MLKKYSQAFEALLFFVDVLIILIAWHAAYFLRFYAPFSPGYTVLSAYSEHLRLSLILIFYFFLAGRFMDFYQPMRLKNVSSQISAVFKVSLFTILFFIVHIYFFKTGLHYSRLTIGYFFLLNFISLCLLRIFALKSLRHLRTHGYNLRHILLVGSGELAGKVVTSLKAHSEYGLKFVGILSRHKDQVGSCFKGEKVIGTYDQLSEILSRCDVDTVIIALPAHEERMIRPILGYIDNESVDIRVVLDIGNFFTIHRNLEEIDGLPVISLRESPFYGWQRMFKRAIDILVSSFCLLFFAPLFVVVAILIKLSSRGPVFYAQERVGLDGMLFKIIKFRTMKVDAEVKSGPVWAVKDDVRCTVVGTVLRRFSLDELPQLINVFLGQMSLVGPRPERPVFVEKFKKHIPRYALRHKIKAGMTGWAQVNGLRGDCSLEERLNYDLYYIEHWSIRLDMFILARTLPAVLKGEGAH